MKYIGNVYIFAWESKKVHAAFKCVLWFPHISPVIALNVFSKWIITKIQPAGWYLWKEVQDELNPEETFTKKAQFFLFLGKGFPILDNFYKILGWNKWAVFPVVGKASIKNPVYGRHWISLPMRIVALMP